MYAPEAHVTHYNDKLKALYKIRLKISHSVPYVTFCAVCNISVFINPKVYQLILLLTLGIDESITLELFDFVIWWVISLYSNVKRLYSM